MRAGLAVVTVVLSSLLLFACSSDDATQNEVSEPSSEPPAATVEVTREVTVERTVTARPEPADESAGGNTREALPGPAVPAEADIQRTVGEAATLDSGNSVTVFSGQSGVPPEESVYPAREGMDFFVVEAEVCVPESADEPSYFTPREFNLLNDDTVRRMASVPTRLPALRGSSVDPGGCSRGYITFQVEEGEEPQAVVYEGSSVVEWELAER